MAFKEIIVMKWQTSKSQRPKSKIGKCGNCGWEAHEDVSKCPAKGKECFKCR